MPTHFPPGKYVAVDSRANVNCKIFAGSIERKQVTLTCRSDDATLYEISFKVDSSEHEHGEDKTSTYFAKTSDGQNVRVEVLADDEEVCMYIGV